MMDSPPISCGGGIRTPQFSPSQHVSCSLEGGGAGGVKAKLSEVFGHGVDEVGRGHEDTDGADDGEDGEGHEAQAVHHAGGELPLAADRLALVLAAEAVGDVADVLQDLGQVGVPLGGLPGVQQVVVRGGAGQAAAHDARVGRGGAVHAVQAAEADVQQVAVGGRGARHRAHLHAGQAAAALPVLADGAHLVLARPLHAQEPRAPVQEDDSGLGRRWSVRGAGKRWGGPATPPSRPASAGPPRLPR